MNALEGSGQLLRKDNNKYRLELVYTPAGATASEAIIPSPTTVSLVRSVPSPVWGQNKLSSRLQPSRPEHRELPSEPGYLKYFFELEYHLYAYSLFREVLQVTTTLRESLITKSVHAIRAKKTIICIYNIRTTSCSYHLYHCGIENGLKVNRRPNIGPVRALQNSLHTKYC